MTSPLRSPTLGRVLVVEDDRAFSALLETHLTRAHLEVVCAGSGLAAWNVLHSDPLGFDVVLSDLRMPRLGGMDLLALLRAERNIPFVLMTAFAEPFVRESAKELGAAAVLSKPFELDALTEILFGLIAGRIPATG
jgi:CheY-like chemotaxis protein